MFEVRGAIAGRVVNLAVNAFVIRGTTLGAERWRKTRLSLRTLVGEIRDSNWPFHADRADIVLIKDEGVGNVNGFAILVINFRSLFHHLKRNDRNL
jgi:hypothetical protein